MLIENHAHPTQTITNNEQTKMSRSFPGTQILFNLREKETQTWVKEALREFLSKQHAMGIATGVDTISA